MSRGGRRTRATRGGRTRIHLLAAAAEVFAERGYERATVDEIAERAGFTKGAVYSTFRTKEELFLALYEQRQQDMLAAFFDAAAASADDATALLTDVYKRLAPTDDEYALWLEFELYARRKPALRARLRTDNEALLGQLVGLVEQRCRALGTEPPLPYEALARLYAAIFDGLTHQRLFDPDGVPEELFARLVAYVDEPMRGDD